MTPLPEPVTPKDKALAWIAYAYTRLESQSGLSARPAQHRLSRLVCAALLARKPLAAEAPTGTGKTLAYLLGALAAQEVSGTPVVVSTATKALQQQLVSTDLPRLVALGVIDPKVVALAKGRSNYICLREAHGAVHSLIQMGMDGEGYADDRVTQMEPSEVSPMISAFDSGKWNGDFDLYEGVRPRSVIPIAVSSDTCIRNKCEHFRDCAYFKARKELTGARLVVANHDLVLADLAVVADGGDGTFPVERYNVIFDEAHHLPEKAIAVGSADTNLVSLNVTLPKLTGAVKILESFELVKNAVARNLRLSPEVMDPTELRARLRLLLSALNALDVREDTEILRFPKGTLPPDVQKELKAVIDEAARLHRDSVQIANFLRDGLSQAVDLPPGPVTQTKLHELSKRILEVKRHLGELLKFDGLLQSGNRLAVWMVRDNKVIRLNAAPLEGADVLRPLLWAQERAAGVVMVSATLRDLGGFERFTKRAGLPPSAYCEAMPYTFDYGKSQLVVADMSATPKYGERQEFVKELKAKLPRAIRPNEGTLLLFPSWAMLKDFTPMLQAQLGDRLRVQGEQPVRVLVREHCEAIDRGEGAVLAGVATLAEGLDLPGKYCMHVAIMALPFAVPADPVEEELAELLGNQYFAKRSLPDAMTRLTQMVGRLLRRESDEGRVTIFDRRLASTGYGREMMRALPPFNKVIEKVSAATP